MTSTGDTSDTTTDQAMTRSEERLDVSTRRRVIGRARLQKFVTTETVTVEVQVRREEVRLVHEPVDHAGDGTDAAGRHDSAAVAASAGEVVVVLHEERPVVTLEVVPVERARMVVETVTTTETASDEVRTEHIELEHDVDTRTAGG